MAQSAFESFRVRVIFPLNSGSGIGRTVRSIGSIQLSFGS